MGKKQQAVVKAGVPANLAGENTADMEEATELENANVDDLDELDLMLASEMAGANGAAAHVPPGHILVPARLVKTVVVLCPVGDLDSGHYVSRHVEVQLNHEQSTALKRLFHGLEAAAAKLASGRSVVTAADAVRWLLERVADEREGVVCEG